MKNKKCIRLVMIIACVILLSACGKQDAGHTKQTNVVDKVINEQISNADNKTDTGTAFIENETVVEDTETDVKESTVDNAEIVTSGTDVDYDLTKMNSDMVYATVYQLMVDPDTYIGKTIRMKGIYYSTLVEDIGNRYFYCIISDAASCCAQGLEFVWDDGSHVYPDEYPEEESNIVVEGTFETYREDGDSNLYCRLKNSQMIIK